MNADEGEAGRRGGEGFHPGSRGPGQPIVVEAPTAYLTLNRLRAAQLRGDRILALVVSDQVVGSVSLHAATTVLRRWYEHHGFTVTETRNTSTITAAEPGVASTHRDPESHGD